MHLLGIGLLALQIQFAGVSGSVTKPGSSEPLARASVVLTPVPSGPTSRPRSTTTEDDGRFSLTDIEPGDYTLSADSARYGRVVFGQRRPEGPGAVLSITPGQQLSGLRLSMVPSGAIAGRITGRNGEPAVSAPVQALRYVYRDGRKILVPVQSTTTDDRGEYRLFWLPEGKYVVQAAVNVTSFATISRPPVAPGINVTIRMPELGNMELIVAESSVGGTVVTRVLEDGTTQEESWIPNYYPSTGQLDLATMLDLKAGATLTGVDIAINPARVQRVRGRVTGFNSGSPPTVTLVPQNKLSEVFMPLVGKGASATDGNFEFRGVLPGSYYVVARDTRSLPGLSSSPVAVSVAERDVDNVTVGLAPGIRLNGKVTLEGALRNTPEEDPLRGLVIWVRPDLVGFPSEPANQVVTSSGSFTVDLPPGDYLLSVNSTTNRPPEAQPFYMKSVRFGTADVMDGLRVTADPRGSIDIVLTTETGSVEGIAVDQRGGLASNATVVLIPDSGRKQASRYKAAVTGSDGRFRFQGIVPGDYKVFAWQDVENGAWQDPGFIGPIESRGRAVRVSGGGSTNDVRVQVIEGP